MRRISPKGPLAGAAGGGTRAPQTWQRISWDEALDEIASRLRTLAAIVPFPDLNGLSDSVANCQVVIRRTNVNQPNVHWGDGAELVLLNVRFLLDDAGALAMDREARAAA